MQQAEFIKQLKQIVGNKNLLTDAKQTAIYCKGFRFGGGKASMVVLPQSLYQLWQVAELCSQQGKIIIVQAANTGLTGGSTPDGDNYDREVILISVNALKGLHILNNGAEILAFPGSSLTELENGLKPYNREPHSVIGSSCIGASVIGGVCNNSGGALVRRGPAFTEMALFARINAQGKLELINRLGIELGDTPQQILTNLAEKNYQVTPESSANKRTWADDYSKKIRDINSSTPARYNADPSYWHDASGCSGKVIVFAVRLSSFAAADNPQVFYIGTNDEKQLIELRKQLLTKLDKLPIAAEYMDKECFNVTERFGKVVYLAIKWFGAQSMPGFYRMKNKLDNIAKRIAFLPKGVVDKFNDLLSRFTPSHLPKRLREYRDKYRHYLILQIEQDQLEQTQQLLAQNITGDSSFFLCSAEEGEAAFLHRFAAGGSPGVYCEVNNKNNALLSLDLSLRRNDPQWSLQLPQSIQDKLELQAICGHFLCYVIHQYYIVKDGVDKAQVKQEILQYLDSRGAKYPAEHNVGHLYPASTQHLEFFQQLDPTNSLNPGIGQTTKKQNWQE